MTAISILKEKKGPSGDTIYRAVAGNGTVQSTGRTAGEALDALTVELGEETNGTLVVTQEIRPDEFFTEAQIRRLQELMERVKSQAIAMDEQAELNSLIEAELLASACRTKALADAMGR